MSRYQHTKGQIKDNAIEALLHDPLFRQRVEKECTLGKFSRLGNNGSVFQHSFQYLFHG